MALESFAQRDSPFARFYGFGHGFRFSWWLKGVTGHVHITPVAFYVRYGLIGAAFFAFLLMQSGWTLWKAWCRVGSTERSLAFALQVAATMMVLSSFVAGYMVLPLAWCTLGLGNGMARRLAAAERRQASAVSLRRA